MIRILAIGTLKMIQALERLEIEMRITAGHVTNSGYGLTHREGFSRTFHNRHSKSF